MVVREVADERLLQGQHVMSSTHTTVNTIDDGGMLNKDMKMKCRREADGKWVVEGDWVEGELRSETHSNETGVQQQSSGYDGTMRLHVMKWT